jgi:hypothetical protein
LNRHSKKRTNYLLISLLLIGAAAVVYFFVPSLRRLNLERLSVAQLQEKLNEQRQAVEEFQHPTEEEKASWGDSKQRLKSICQSSIDTSSLNDELTRQARLCNISDIIITPQKESGVMSQESGVEGKRSLLRISFLADYEPLGRFLQWFDDHPQQAAILSLNIKRGFPLVSVEIEVEVCQFTCNW